MVTLTDSQQADLLRLAHEVLYARLYHARDDDEGLRQSLRVAAPIAAQFMDRLGSTIEIEVDTTDTSAFVQMDGATFAQHVEKIENLELDWTEELE